MDMFGALYKFHFLKLRFFYFPDAELWLSFWSEVHYNSLYEIQGLCTMNSLLFKCQPQEILGCSLKFTLTATELLFLFYSCSSSTEAKEETLVVLEEVIVVGVGMCPYHACIIIILSLRILFSSYSYIVFIAESWTLFILFIDCFSLNLDYLL